MFLRKVFITYANFWLHSSLRTDFLIMTMHSKFMAWGQGTAQRLDDKRYRKSIFFFFTWLCLHITPRRNNLTFVQLSLLLSTGSDAWKQIQTGERLLFNFPALIRCRPTFSQLDIEINLKGNDSIEPIICQTNIIIMSDIKQRVGTGCT